MAGLMCAASTAAIISGISVWKAAGWTGAAIGLGVAAVSLVYGATVVAGGRAADRWGSRAAGGAGAALGLVACAVATAATSAHAALGAGLVSAAAGAFCFPSLARWIAGARNALPLHARVSRYNLGWAA
jgi:hypothetical protein